MSQNITAAPVTAGVTQTFALTCATGFVQRRPQIGFQPGTHRVVDTNGTVVACISSDRINLNSLEGRFVTVCGTPQGVVEGCRFVLVTQVLNAPSGTPLPSPQIDLRLLLLLLLLSQPGATQGLNVVQLLLLNQLLGGRLGFGIGGLGGLSSISGALSSLASVSGAGTAGVGVSV